MKDLSVVKELNEYAYDFLSSFDASKYQDGRIELEGGVYVNIESFETMRRCERRYEAHKKYIDLMYMIDGEEIITVAPVSELTVAEPYNETRDVEFYENNLKGMDYSLRTGEFMIFRPGEGHMPAIALNGIKKIRKAVVKIPVK
ncbi:MAG: YhcH/YjgK/YiaL family protein [Firmicutes bacterium]|nr:YhcH/YjgK/YiaL family protein [Bacillota bacterium]